MAWRLIIIAAALFFAAARGNARDNVYTLKNALQELHDLSLLQTPPDPPRSMAVYSSAGETYDAGNFLRQEGEEFVIMDVRGPGILTRLWTDEPMGYLRFYWDGAEEPQYKTLWHDLAQGKTPPLEAPFVSTAGGGCSMRFPLPFEKGLKITLSGQAWCEWVAEYQYFAPDQNVESWWPALGAPPGVPPVYTKAAETWEDPFNAEVPGDVMDLGLASFFAGSAGAVYTAEEDVIVTEAGFQMNDSGPMPLNVVFHVHSDDAPTSAPFAAMAGVWETNVRGASLLQGRQDDFLYIRVPFLLKSGERVSFNWEGEAKGEVIGRPRLKTIPLGEADAPRLSIHWKTNDKGDRVRHLENDGRLVQLNLAPGAAVDAQWLSEGANLASISYPTLRSCFETGSPSVRALGGFQRDSNNAVAWRSFFPSGLAYQAQDDYTFCDVSFGDLGHKGRTNFCMISQRFDSLAFPSRRITRRKTSDYALIGTRVTHPGTGTLPGYEEFLPPITGHWTSQPREIWPREDGTFTLSRGFTSCPSDVNVFIDLPHRWSGTAGSRVFGQWRKPEKTDFFDIGWPPLCIENSLYWDTILTARINLPSEIQGGDYLVQVRGEAGHGSNVYTDKGSLTVHVPTRGTPAITWQPEDINATSNTIALSLPESFLSEAGDALVVDWTLEPADGDFATTAALAFSPTGPIENNRGMSPAVESLLPKDGHVYTRALVAGRRIQSDFPAGRYQSWLGKPRDISIHLEHAEGTRIDIHGARLYRAIPPPETVGWSRRVPYVEWPEKQFRHPGAKAILQGNGLRPMLETLAAAPPEKINPHFRNAEYLENIEAGPLQWRIAETPYREGALRPSHSFAFRSEHIGTRLILRDERIKGERFFGFEFGYGPTGARVGIRDCEGRLVHVQDLFLNKPRTVPQWTWVALPGPSRDPFLYLEVLGVPPGSLGEEIILQKFMIGVAENP